MATPTNRTPIILDGGLSRELTRLGAPFAQPEWSALSLLEPPGHPLIKQAHADFLSAGASIITTNSYAVVPFHIGEDRFWERGRELAALSGRLAREAADEVNANGGGGEGGKRVRVAGCLPPVFGSYEPQRFEGGKVEAYLRVLVQALEPYVDFWLGETLSLIAEAEAVLEATKGTGKAVWISFCPDDGDGASVEEPKLRSGESIAEVARWALRKWEEGRVSALLFNCARPAFVEAALDVAVAVRAAGEAGRTIAGKERLKLGVYANAMVPKSNEVAANEGISDMNAELTPEAYAEMAQRWHSKGADIVGGCCGIGHDHIRAVARTLQAPSAATA